MSSRGSSETNGVGFGGPFLGTDLVAVQADLAHSYGEFAIIKIGIVDTLPNANEFNGAVIGQPVQLACSGELALRCPAFYALMPNTASIRRPKA